MSGGDHPGDAAPDFEESAEDLYENAPCGYLSAAPDGTLVRVNGTFLRWTGYRREDLVGVKRFQDLLTVGGRIYHETHYAPLLRMQGKVREIAVDIVAAAPMPRPTTSPTTSPSVAPFSSQNASYQSPPTSSPLTAGRYATSTSRPGALGSSPESRLRLSC